MRRASKAAAIAAGVIFAPIALIVAAVGALGGQSPTVQPNTTAEASATIPATDLALYQAAAPSCPGLDWTVLAAVGTVESSNGTSTLPGVASGANFAGAEGPMQFEPGTFASYDTPVPPGGANPPSPYDTTDAIYAAARYLCSLGIGNDVGSALIAYNCGDTSARCVAASSAYAAEVRGIASGLGTGGSGPGTLGAQVVAYATSQLGVAYEWGGESPGTVFDCSGLAQWAWAQAGVSLPRVAQDQYDAGPQIPISQLEPGDLVFFGPEDGEAVGHVGIYVGNGKMVDAPDTGAVVRYDPINQFSPALVGATDPGGGA